jgi:hypothetical protein
MAADSDGQTAIPDPDAELLPVHAMAQPVATGVEV